MMDNGAGSGSDRTRGLPNFVDFTKKCAFVFVEDADDFDVASFAMAKRRSEKLGFPGDVEC